MIDRPRFREPDDEKEYLSPVCPICEKRPVEDDGEICDRCLKLYAKDFNFSREYLKSQKKQAIGHTSWTDFVLRYIYGISDCENPALVTELLGCFEDGYTVEQKNKLGQEVNIKDALADYVLDGCLGDFQDYIKEVNFVME